ncbi:unnamed protein product [Rangifer tarandus platyrhynchus]|uniref:Uncharacterized protein n=1 Tax=Rangifer tarandus platyrhynchus TaxID=3082113 RepID=A0AC59YB35_RANTA
MGQGAGRVSSDFCSCPQTPTLRALACGALEVGGGRGGGEPPGETGGWELIGCGGERTGLGVGPPGPPYLSQASGLSCLMGPVVKIACGLGRDTQMMSFLPFFFKLQCSTFAKHTSQFLGRDCHQFLQALQGILFHFLPPSWLPASILPTSQGTPPPTNVVDIHP